MFYLRILPLLCAAALAAAIAWAAVHTPLVDGFAHVVADRWGIVTLIDLYAGFAVILVVIALLEPRRAVVVAVVVATPVLGSIVPALWLAARVPLLLRARLSL